jgi:Uma2 family endonuclease
MTAVLTLINELQTPDPSKIRQLEVEEYQTLIEQGFFQPGERVELIDGYLVTMSPINPPHAATLSRLATIFTIRLKNRVIVRTQSPIVLLELKSQPEPDLVLAELREDGYDQSHPGSKEILLVVEVSDSTLKYDREDKKFQYAAAGIPEYWIVNLLDFVLEVYREPFISETGEADYRSKTVVLSHQRAAPALYPKCRILLQDVLPQPGE